jgi:hypothetical protein
MKKLLLAALFAFMIFTNDGGHGIMRGAIGFYIEDGNFIFFNEAVDSFVSIPADKIKCVVYVPDDKAA